MSFGLFISFNGNCREALDFYSKVFGQEVQSLMLYSEMPPDPKYVVPESDKNLVMFSNIPVFGCNVMFSDTPSGVPFVAGNNINPTLGTKDMDEIKRLFKALGEGGKVEIELQQTFWSDLYGTVTDKFGITWQLCHASEKFL